MRASFLPTLFLLSVNANLAIAFAPQRTTNIDSTSTILPSSSPKNNKMDWADHWDDIVQGGPQRWKVTDAASHQAALTHIKKYVQTKASIFCPLAGDDPMVHLLWQQGHSVTAMDLVPTALEQMRNQFEGSWTSEEKENGMVLWRHESGRVTQYQGDALQSQEELKNQFDVVYDKDSFGALPKDRRNDYCSRISEYTKEGAIIYMEVVLRDDHDQSKNVGPPFSLKQEDLMNPTCYGTDFNYVDGLGSVYPESNNPGGMEQTGHVLARK